MADVEPVFTDPAILGEIPGGGLVGRGGRGRRRRTLAREGRRPATEAERGDVRRRQRERFGRGVADLFEIPTDIALNVPRITMIGNLQMIIENHRGLIEYSRELVRVGAGNGQIVVIGTELAVGSVLAEDLSVMGRFASVSFEEMGEDDRSLADGRRRTRP
jgi:sporulation protein YqfC